MRNPQHQGFSAPHPARLPKVFIALVAVALAIFMLICGIAIVSHIGGIL